MKKGFTLIELLVSITIILILTSFGVVYYTGAQKKARDSKRQADLEQLRSALEMYRNDEDVYPTASGSVAATLAVLETSEYINDLPTDPKGYSYHYTSSDGYTYYLCAFLETGGDGASDCGDDCSAPEDADCNYQVNNP
jgi:general secretion pathway protein G